MNITARLDEDVVRQLLGELLPVTIVLDDEDRERRIWIDRARSVDFAANEGLHVEVGGQLHWKIAGVAVVLTIQSAQLLLTPAVVDDVDGARLVFRPALAKMDLKSIPGFVDSGITGIVNKRLEAEGDKLAWHFGRDLANQCGRPECRPEGLHTQRSPGPKTVRVRPRRASMAPASSRPNTHSPIGSMA